MGNKFWVLKLVQTPASFQSLLRYYKKCEGHLTKLFFYYCQAKTLQWPSLHDAHKRKPDSQILKYVKEARMHTGSCFKVIPRENNLQLLIMAMKTFPYHKPLLFIWPSQLLQEKNKIPFETPIEERLWHIYPTGIHSHQCARILHVLR